MMNENDGNKITINFKRASGESADLIVKKTDKPIDIIQQLKQKWPNFKVDQLVFNGNNVLNSEKTWSELTKENNIMVYVCGLESLITVHFSKLGKEEEKLDVYVRKDDKICDIISILEGRFINFEVAQLNLNDNLQLLWRSQDGKINAKTWGDLHVDKNDIAVVVGGKQIDKYYDSNKNNIDLEDRSENKTVVNWKFIFSSSPFLVLTLLALILQWHIAFVISFLIINLVLVAIGLWPKIRTCCPRKISSSYESENQNPSEDNISQNLNLEQGYQQNQNINFQ